MDSLLVVNQVNGGYCARTDSMAAYLTVVLSKKAYFRQLRLFHIPRSENRHADALAFVAAMLNGSEKEENRHWHHRKSYNRDPTNKQCSGSSNTNNMDDTVLQLPPV